MSQKMTSMSREYKCFSESLVAGSILTRPLFSVMLVTNGRAVVSWIPTDTLDSRVHTLLLPASKTTHPILLKLDEY